MFCPKCGASLVDGAEFCQKCGAQIKKPAEVSEPKPAEVYTEPTTNPVMLKPKTDNTKRITISVIAASVAVVVLLSIIGVVSSKIAGKEEESGYSQTYEDTYEGDKNVGVTGGYDEIQEELDTVNAADNILVEGIPAVDLLGMSEEEVQNIVGGSWSYNGPGFLYEYGDNDWIIFYTDDSGTVISVNGSANHFSLDGKPLNIKESELTTLLGSNYEVSDWDGEVTLTWAVGNNSIVFTIASDSEMPYEVVLKRGENYSQAAEDNYPYGYEEDYNIDPELVGRWRSYDGGTLEIGSNGYLTSLDFKFWSYGVDNPTYCKWTTDNGQISATLYFESLHEYKFTGPQGRWDVDTLTLYGDYGNSLDYQRDSEGSTDLAGSWISEFGYGIGMDLYADGSGKMNSLTRSYDMIWEAYTEDGKKYLDYMVIDYGNLDYKVYGDSLELFTDDGTRFYTKVGN